MTTTAEAVERHLETDVALVDLLARDLARLRQTARWLIDEYGWEDTSEQAVVSALRRYAEEHPTPPLTRDRELLGETAVDAWTGMALMTLPRTEDIHDRIPDVWSAFESLDVAAVVPGRRRIRLLVDADRVAAVESILPPGRIESVQTPVSAIQIRLPKEPEAVSLVGHAVSALVHRGVEVLDVLTCGPEAFLIVPEGETVDAFEVVGRLTRQPDLSPAVTSETSSESAPEEN